MPDPKVSFIVPCYRLAHFLGECLQSILSQSFRDFEILVMDDCSPDNTGDVARSFTDPRVRYVRNDPNLGHLKNYNKGIQLSRGEFVWLISADDVLAKPYVLERYLQVLASNSRVGYAFCPAIGLFEGKETGVGSYFFHGDHDAVFNGRNFLTRRLLASNGVPAAAGLVRRECYDKISVFPVDMPYAGDWFLWAVFALYYDVAYFAEPMVYYREHGGSMTNHFKGSDPKRLADDDFRMLWRMKERAGGIGETEVVGACETHLADRYTSYLRGEEHRGIYRMSIDECRESLHCNAGSVEEQRRILARIYVLSGDKDSKRGDFESAAKSYADALRTYPAMPKVALKYLALRSGSPGIGLLQWVRAMRQRIAGLN